MKTYNNNRGAVLIVAMLLGLTAAIICVVYIRMASTENKLATRSFGFNATLDLAEGAIEDAMWAVNNDTANPGTFLVSANGWTAASDNPASFVKKTNTTAGSFTTVALGQGMTGEMYARIDNYPGTAANPTKITSMGVIRVPNQPAMYKELAVTLSTNPRGFFPGGIVAKGTVTFTGNGATDSYNSKLGFWNALTNRFDKGSVASTALLTSDITLTGNATIYGQLSVGGSSAAADVVANGNASYTDAQTPAGVTKDPKDITTNFTFNFPTINTPTNSGATAGTNLGAVSSSITLGTAGATTPTYYYISSIKLSGKNTVTIQGPVVLVVSGDIGASGQSSISVNGTGNAGATIYAGGNVDLSGQNAVNNSNPAAATFLVFDSAPLSANTTVSLTGQAGMISGIYAPNSNVKVSGLGDVAGSIVGNNVTYSGNGSFHYDQQLGSIAAAPTPGGPMSWVELTGVGGVASPYAKNLQNDPFSSVSSL